MKFLLYLLLLKNIFFLLIIKMNHFYYFQQVNVSSMPSYEEFEVPLSNTFTKARVKLTLPPVLRKNEDYTFPLLVNM